MKAKGLNSNELLQLSRSIIDSLDTSIIVVDKAGRIIEANRHFLRWFKLKKSELHGKTCRSFYRFMAGKRCSTDCPLKQLVKTGKSTRRTYETMVNGKKKFFAVSTHAIREKGEIRFIAHVVRDITKVKLTEESLKRAKNQLISLHKTSTMLQETMDVDEIVSIAINTFLSLGYDRVRVYVRNNGYLKGVKASYIEDAIFKKIRIEISRKNPKTYSCMTRKKPVIEEYNENNELTRILKKKNLKESASLPLLSKDKAIGMISLDNIKSKKPLVKKELNMLMTFTNQIAVAIENAMLYSENKKKLRTLSALYDIASAISTTLDIEKILNLIVIKIIKLIKADICSILLFDDSGSLSPMAVYDLKGLLKKENIIYESRTNMRAVRTKTVQYKRFLRDKSKSRRKAGCIRSMLSVPLIVEDNPTGVINIYTRNERKFNDEEINLLKSLSYHASIMIENSKLYQRIKKDKESLTKLVEISRKINSTLNLDDMLKIIINDVVEMTNADFGIIMLIEKDYLKLALSKGIGEEKLKKTKVKIGKGVVGFVAEKMEPVIISDIRKERKRYKEYAMASDSIRSEATIPLLSKGKIIGVLDLESRKTGTFDKFKKTLRILTNQIAIAIENARLYSEINNFNKRLKDEIETATKELREKNRQLEKMDQMKSDFVSNVSHELRTPLTSILGYTKLLYSEKLGEINDRQRESLKIISEESERLSRLINDVLDLSKLESKKMKVVLEEVNLCEIAKASINAIKVKADEKNIRIYLDCKGNTITMAGKDLIMQVFANLLSNAVKFSYNNSKIEVFVKQEREHITVRVKDYGEGIAKEEIPRLFDKFYQVDSSITRKHEGTGLGLVIVKHIIELHKGSINVESELGKGSTFSFSLPLRRGKRI